MKAILLLAICLTACKESPKTTGKPEMSDEIKELLAESDRTLAMAEKAVKERAIENARLDREADRRIAAIEAREARDEAVKQERLRSMAEAEAEQKARFADYSRRREAEKSEREAERRNRDLIRAIEGTRR